HVSPVSRTAHAAHTAGGIRQAEPDLQRPRRDSVMNCAETAVRLYQYLDRELSAEEIVEVKLHLEACPPCLHIFHYEEHMRRLVRQACCESAPITLRERILRYRQS